MNFKIENRSDWAAVRKHAKEDTHERGGWYHVGRTTMENRYQNVKYQISCKSLRIEMNNEAEGKYLYFPEFNKEALPPMDLVEALLPTQHMDIDDPPYPISSRKLKKAFQYLAIVWIQVKLIATTFITPIYLGFGPTNRLQQSRFALSD